ncbi:hypothetical protein FHX44_118136 [Pseudonocardia hierapolitana]|uniref:Uncharacterized protein n=1 Tax=Pseudonocardia hierapolitana TaxID=1128676 RepID=A0A561T4Z9_9PSEU|nr:hypothetical protein FHX44_118136 [Pseudonocardia hierapolitana]
MRHDNVRFQRARATGVDVIMLMGGRIAGDRPEPMPPPRG